MSTSTHERKAVSLLLLPSLTSRLTSPSDILVVFNQRTIKLMLNSANSETKNKALLMEIGVKCLDGIKDSALADDKSAEFKFKLATTILTVDAKFDNKTRVQLTSSLLTSLDKESASSYLAFLENSILGSSKDLVSLGSEGEEGEEKRRVERGRCTAFVEALYLATKIFKGAGEFVSDAVTEQVYAFLMAASFFDCSDVKAPEVKDAKKKKGKGKKAREDIDAESSSVNPAVASALKIKCTLPFSVRSFATSRFFSLMADLTTAPTIKESNSKYQSTHAMWVALESSGCSLVRGELEEDGMRARVMASEISSRASEIKDGRVAKAADAIANLTMALTLQILNEGKDENLTGMMVLDDEENLDDEVCATVEDLFGAAGKLLGGLEGGIEVEGDDEEEEFEPTAVIADVCVGALNMGTNSSNRGASVRALRDAVKRCWAGVLQINDDVLGAETVKVLKEGICGENEEEEEGGEVKEESDEESVQEGVFSKAVLDEEDEEEEEEEDDDEDEDEEGDDDDSVELDAGALGDMLIDSDDDEEGALEHHEGADAALAHMLKVQAQTRKKSRMQQEQIRVDHKLRAITLLEQALNKGKLGNFAFSLLLPLIRLRRTLFAASSNKGLVKKPVVNAKKALLEKLTKLYTSKLVKAKGDGGDDVEEIFDGMVEEARKSPNAAHLTACSLGMIMCIKTGKLGGNAKKVYGELLKEWGEKKNSNLQAGIFEDAVERIEDAPELMLDGLVKVVEKGKIVNDFIKGEMYKLLAKIYSKKNGNFYDFEHLKVIVESLKESLGEGLKTKRLKFVIVCCEKIVEHGKAERGGDEEFWGCLENGLVEGLMLLSTSKAQQVVKAAKGAVDAIAEGVAKCEGGEGDGSGKKKGKRGAETKEVKKKTKKVKKK